MNFKLNEFEINSSKAFSLSEFNTSPKERISDDDSKKIIRDNVKDIADFQERMFANGKQSVLIVFQAIDAAGKDGTIERLLTGINPQGVMVSAFKRPTPEELAHDFLWRVQRKLPPKGIIGVFNRSHYEEVLVVKVHPEFLVPQNLPGILSPEDVNESFWLNRYSSIREFEKRLVENGTRIIKFFLYVSKEEQKRRILDRMDEKDKHWKFNVGDIHERPHWDSYLNAYESAIQHTATPDAPWFIIPADHKDTMRALVTEIVKTKLAPFKENWPEAGPEIEAEISEGRNLLNAEK